MTVIMMNDDLDAGYVESDAEEEGTGAVRKAHGFRFIRHPSAQVTEKLVRDFLTDKYFHDFIFQLILRIPEKCPRRGGRRYRGLSPRRHT